MPRIQINEIDNTRAGFAEATNEVVYIPGFCSATSNLKPGQVKLFTTISQFEADCGAEPQPLNPKTYGDIVTALGENFEIDLGKLGVETQTTFSDVDMSYIYAKECLASGLAVLYENIDAEASVIKAYQFICQKLFNVDEQKWYFVRMDDGSYYYYNAFGKCVKIKKRYNDLYNNYSIILGKDTFGL